MLSANKARDCFSEYLEGTLDPVQRAAMDRRLSTDPSLRQEYEEFAHIYSALPRLSILGAEPPIDLHERISRRLDQHIYEQERREKPAWRWTWARSLAFGSVAALLVVSGIALFFPGRGIFIAGPAITSSAPVLPSLRVGPKGVILQWTPPGEATLRIRSGIDGPVLEEVRATGNVVTRTLNNRAGEPSFVTINVSNSSQPLYVALPGTESRVSREGSGTLAELSQAMAVHFDRPVLLEAADPSVRLSWRLEGRLIEDAVRLQLGPGISVVERDTGLLCLIVMQSVSSENR